MIYYWICKSFFDQYPLNHLIMIKTVCKKCGSEKSFNEDKFGKKFKCPNCGNCKNFKFDSQSISEYGRVYNKQSNLRCGIGNFAVGKSNWCKEHSF